MAHDACEEPDDFHLVRVAGTVTRGPPSRVSRIGTPPGWPSTYTSSWSSPAGVDDQATAAAAHVSASGLGRQHLAAPLDQVAVAFEDVLAWSCRTADPARPRPRSSCPPASPVRTARRTATVNRDAVRERRRAADSAALRAARRSSESHTLAPPAPVASPTQITGPMRLSTMPAVNRSPTNRCSRPRPPRPDRRSAGRDRCIAPDGRDREVARIGFAGLLRG